MSVLVIFSGGQDSTTALFWAKEHLCGDPIEEDGRTQPGLYALTFDYGQKHINEIAAAREISTLAGVSRMIIRNLEGMLPGSALVAEDRTREPISPTGGYLGLPSTFTPGRNALFLTVAAAQAFRLGTHNIVAGVCQTDYSGYPDCRRPFIDALQNALSLGMEWPIYIHTPLMELTKADSVRLAQELPGCFDALSLSITCYQGERGSCGECPACVLRTRGFMEAGVEDPALEQ